MCKVHGATQEQYPCLMPLDDQLVNGTGEAASPLYDTTGRRIYAGGGGVIRVKDTYYWFGMDFSDGTCRFQGINCYSSPDLVTWTYQGAVLSPQTPGLELAGWVGRPHVIAHFHDQNAIDYFVMCIEYNDEGRNRIGIATSPEVSGTYRYHGHFLAFDTYTIGDHTLFQDYDGSAYLVYVEDDMGDEKEKGGYDNDGGCNRKLVIARLSDDYLQLAERTVVIRFRPGNKQEAPVVVRQYDRYYIFTSGTHGWNASATNYMTAPAMAGPWSAFTPLSTYPASDSSYNTQITDIISMGSGVEQTMLYLGDQWNEADFADMRYAWLPLLFSTNGHLL